MKSVGLSAVAAVWASRRCVTTRRSARALAGSVLRARGVAAGLVRSPEARGSAFPRAPPRSPLAAWADAAAREGWFPGASTRRWSSLASAAAVPDPSPTAAPPPTRGRLRQMRVAELRAACAARGLDDRGRKNELVARLEEQPEGAVGGERASTDANGHEHERIEQEDWSATREESDANATSRLFARTSFHERADVSSPTDASSSSRRTRNERALSPNEHGIDPRSIPRYVRVLQRRLARRDASNDDGEKHRLFVVGGAARDLFLGKTPRDFDLLTDASWAVIKKRAQPCVVVGRRFKVAHCFEERPDAPGKRTGAFFELVSMRGEDIKEADDDDEENEDAAKTETGDFRLPKEVSRRLRLDASRRDFTVNALAYDVESGFLYDFVGAIEDIKSGTVRTVHPSAVTSFKQDPARMLRAARVAARHDFFLAGNVVSALKASAHLLRREHTARLAGELKALFTRGFSEKAVVLLWTTGVLEHVAHLHATHVARAVDPGTNFVAAPPGAFHVPEDTPSSHDVLDEDVADRDEEGGIFSDGEDTPHPLLPADLPWAVSDDVTKKKTGSALTRHRRGGKRVSASTLRRVVRDDPLFRVLRALDRRVARLGDTPCSETLAMACLAAPFAVKKLGWPFLEPEAEPSVEPSAVRRFASARFNTSLSHLAASRTNEERLAWRAAAERRENRFPEQFFSASVSGAREKKKKTTREKTRLREKTEKRADALWRLAFAAWTEEAGAAARVMQGDYHMSAKHVMASALVTMHAPFLNAAPATNVLRRRAEWAARRRRRDGAETDFSTSAQSATFSFAVPSDSSRTTVNYKSRQKGERDGSLDSDASSHADEGLARALRLLAGGDDGKKTTSSRRRSAARGSSRGGVKTKRDCYNFGVAALPGELLAFAEILCDAALDGSAAYVVSDADEAEGERQAARYEVGDDEFDPDEPL